MIPFSFATSVMCDVARPGWFVINHERDSEPHDALYHVVVPCFFPIDWSADSRSFGAKANEGLIGRPQSAGRAFAWPAATLGTLRRTRTREPRRPSRAAMLGPCPIRPSRPNPKLQRSINRQPEGCTCPPSPLLPMSSRATRLPFSFGCHSLAWRPRCSLIAGAAAGATRTPHRASAAAQTLHEVVRRADLRRQVSPGAFSGRMPVAIY
jgi:hypothetical protein